MWSELLADRRLLQRAYALDGVAEELLFVSGRCSWARWRGGRRRAPWWR
ncbi:hypothetical protein [Streptomyces sp. TP-A0356]|nr:hypothetical protein [Streptomyces sp. TP-A0356]